MCMYDNRIYFYEQVASSRSTNASVPYLLFMCNTKLVSSSRAVFFLQYAEIGRDDGDRGFLVSNRKHQPTGFVSKSCASSEKKRDWFQGGGRLFHRSTCTCVVWLLHPSHESCRRRGGKLSRRWAEPITIHVNLGNTTHNVIDSTAVSYNSSL